MDADKISKNISDLVFFDKSGTCYNFDYVSSEKIGGDVAGQFPYGCINGTIIVPKVSKGLFETQSLLLCQRYVKSENDGACNYLYGKVCPPIEEDTNWTYMFRWDKAYVIDEIQMYMFDRTPCPPEDTSSLTYFEYDCPQLVFTDNVVVENGVVAYPMNDNGDNTYSPNANYVNGYDEVDICFCDNNEIDYRTYRRDLLLVLFNKDTKEEIICGTFSVYGESEEEDERLVTLCGNLGYSITPEDYKWFKDTDIKEQKEDKIFINNKRKELLTEAHNIYPFIGSYISLINVIRFYGWDNVSIREWWRNVDAKSSSYGKYFIATSYSLTDKEVIRIDGRTTLPSKKFRKTNKITLAYNITIVDNGERMEKHGLPTTKEIYEYNIEEVVIKLFGFRRKLEKEYLPLNAHIVDVVGEAFAFDYMTMTHNVSDCCVYDVKSNARSTFSVVGDDEVYIEDLRPFGLFNENVVAPISGDVRVGEIDNTIDDYNILDENGNVVTEILATDDTLMSFNENDEIVCEDEEGGERRPKAPIDVRGNDALHGVEDLYHGCPFQWYEYVLARDNERGNYYLGDFSDYAPLMTRNSQRANTFDVASGTCLGDREGIPIGALVRLACDNLNLTWDECSFSWNEASASSFTWNSIADKYRGHARIEWGIYKEENETPEFVWSLYGTFADGYGDVVVALPYVGQYSVSMRVWNWNNDVCEQYKDNAINVLPKQVQISSWYTGVPRALSWNDEYVWDEIDNQWDYALKPSKDVSWDSVHNAEYDALDRGSFVMDFYDAEDPNMRMMIWSAEQGSRLSSDWVGAYYWNNADVSWESAKDLTWNNTMLCGGLPAFFEIGWFDEDGNCRYSPNGYILRGSVLELVNDKGEYGSFNFGTNDSSESDLAYYTSQLNESTDKLVSLFNYYYIYDKEPYEGFDEDVSEGYKILAVGKQYGRSCDMSYIGVIESEYQSHIDDNGVLHINRDSDNDTLRFADNSNDYNPNWLNLVCNDGISEVGRMTDVNFNYTDCKINGKRNAEWSMWNINDGEDAEVITYRGKCFHYVFKRPGCYVVRLKLEDTNGNTYVGERKMVLVK